MKTTRQPWTQGPWTLGDENNQCCEVREEATRARASTEGRRVMRALRTTDPIGTAVAVTLDNGQVWMTKTRSEMWAVGSGDIVVMLEGKSGGYLASRCAVDECHLPKKGGGP